MNLIYLIIYFMIINGIGFLTMYIDKKKAIKGSYRISEKTLFIISVFLGAIGVYFGIYKFRHKTKHSLFTIGIPLCIILNIMFLYYIIAYMYR